VLVLHVRVDERNEAWYTSAVAHGDLTRRRLYKSEATAAGRRSLPCAPPPPPYCTTRLRAIIASAVLSSPYHLRRDRPRHPTTAEVGSCNPLGGGGGLKNQLMK